MKKFEDHIVDFLAYLKLEKRYSGHTLIAYEIDLFQFKDYLMSIYKEENINNIDSTYVRSYMVELLSQNNSKSTVARKISALKSIFKYFLKKQLIKESPVSNITTPKVEKRLPNFIKEAEMQQLFNGDLFENNTNGLRDRLILSILYQTGIRLSELIGLKCSDVSKQEIKVTGKRNKQRIVPLSRSLQELVAQYENVSEGKNSIWFLNTDNSDKLYEKFVYRKVNYYLSMVSSKQKKSPHILRHTFATHMLNNGADLNAIKELLGHESLSATQVYTHNTFEKLKSIHKQSHPRG
ncbi:MAG: tyrosine-type recombinase/integrase [Flavobacteriales bacterium]|nr:tyrosine-type recombinase/integrase [Flavobacteriales bacterium]